MTLNKLYIREFGALKDFSADLSDGLNIFYGANESGKSTVLAFIRFIFFGLPPKRGEDAARIRERALSWDGSAADGYIDLTHGGTSYRIERRGAMSADSYTERHAIIDLATGSAAFRGETPAKVFLGGVSAAVFDSSCSVRQLGVGALDGSELGTAIENLLFSADEQTNTGRALTKLDAARRQLSPLRGSNGRIPELERERASLAERLKKAEQDTVSKIALEATAQKYRAVTADVRRKLTLAEDKCRAYETIQVLNRFDMLHASEKKIAALKAEEAELVRGSGKDGKLPEREYIDRLDSISRSLAAAETAVSASAAHLAQLHAENTLGDAGLAAYAESIDDAGGAFGVLAKLSRLRRSKIVRIIAGVALTLLGVSAAAASLVLYFTGSTLLSPKISSAVTVVGFILAIVGIFLFPAAVRKSKEILRFYYSFGYDGENGFKKAAFAAHLDACLGAKRDFDAASSIFMSAESQLATLREAAASVCREAIDALSEFTDIGEDDDIAALLLSTADKAAVAVSKHESIKRDIEKYSASASERREQLSGYDEASLRAHLNPDAIALLENANPTLLKQERDSLAAQLEAGIARLHEAERGLAFNQGAAENPVRIAARLEEVDAELASARKLCEAIMLAHNAIEGAGESLRTSITPRLREDAGKLLSEITHKKYSDIGIDESFAVTVHTPSGAKPLSALSCGTQDAAYFALRLSLIGLLFKDGAPPFMLDEALSHIDDSRADAILRLLSAVCREKSRQCLLFTCHTREEALLRAANADFSLITL
jgi:energy-coupling factor transporter ATP-binding protein EcfA2